MDGIYTMASSSVSSLYGNVNSAIRELIISKFPRNFFNYINTSTEFAFYNMRRQFGGNNSSVEIEKRRKPHLLIQPTYQEPDMDTYLQGVPLTKNIDDLQYRVDKRYLLDIIKDPKYGYNLKFKLNRDRIEFDVRVVLATLHQQLDIYKSITNQIVWERSYAKQTALEAIIPKTIINHVGKLCKMDVEQDTFMVPVLLQHLNSCSQYPITYKLRNASSTDEYYMYYMHNMIVTFYDLHLDEGIMKNMVGDHYDISFKVSVDFNLPGLYVISGNIEDLQKYKVQMVVDSGTSPNETTDTEFVPLFTIDNIYSKYPPEKDGMKLMGSSRFTCEKDVKEDDTLDISTLFELERRKIIQFYSGYHMNPDTIVKLIVLKDNDEIVEGIDYHMNWNNFIITIHKPDRYATYRLVIYLNMAILNDAMRAIPDELSSDKYRLNDNTIDWENILGRGIYQKVKLYDTPLDGGNEGEFKRVVSDNAHPVFNMYNEGGGAPNHMETIKVVTTWTRVLGDAAIVVLRTVEEDPGEIYEYRVTDESTQHTEYLTNMVSHGHGTPSHDTVVVTCEWMEILGFDTYFSFKGEKAILRNLQMIMMDDGIFREAPSIGNSIDNWTDILGPSTVLNELNDDTFDVPIHQ